MNPADTIAAIGSAAGAAARMIVRVSGPSALRFGGELSGRDPGDFPAAAEIRVTLAFANLVVPASIYVFRAPRSYSGDDVVEFHLPGNPLLARLLLEALYQNGARPAEPGEFTARAFFSGRLDLAEAEGVAATIAAGTERELSAARQLMSGELARRLRPAMDGVAEALARVEAGIDFADEEGVTFLTPQQLRHQVAEADQLLARLLEDSTRFERLAHEPTAVLVGRPNAGKSTLLNALAGEHRAVISPIAGTTRDALSAEVLLPRGMLRLVDVAGLEGSEPTPGDPVAQQMRGRATQSVEAADVVILVRDVADARPALVLPRPPDLIVLTKQDLSSGPASAGGVTVSARTGAGLAELYTHLDRIAFGEPQAAGGATLALNARHVEAVREARAALARAGSLDHRAPPEIVAVELREALEAMGRVLGTVTPDDLLGRIFSTFCIGK